MTDPRWRDLGCMPESASSLAVRRVAPSCRRASEVPHHPPLISAKFPNAFRTSRCGPAKNARMKNAELRLSDLESGRTRGSVSKLMNVMVPAELSAAINAAAKDLGCTKTALIVAMLNEGLDVLRTRRSEFPAKPTVKARRGRRSKR
jgi:hypothetical protein